MFIALIAIGIILIIFNTNAIKKEKQSFSSTLNDSEENLKEFQVEIVKLRREFGETVLDIQKEMNEIRNLIDKKSLQKTEKLNEKISENKEIDINNKDKVDDNITENYNNIKVDEIKKLVEDGLDVEQISEKLGVGKGEVILIKELYIK